MEQVTIDRRVMLRRSVVASVTLPVLCCAVVVVFVIMEISGVEYSYAVGVSDQLSAPVFSQLYRAVYGWGWSGPIAGAVIALALVLPKKSYLIFVICYVNFLVLFTTLWLMFALEAFYLQNQTFWGWPRANDGVNLFVNKGKPGTGARVPGGNDLQSGELYMGKLSAPGTQNILRRAVGTYHKDGKGAKKREMDEHVP